MDYQQALPVDCELIREFRVLELLGSGGFANTYLALEEALGRRVAIKEFFPGELAVRRGRFEVQVRTPAQAQLFSFARERFVREAKTLAKFRHPNIVRVFRVFEANQTAYIVLEFVKGAALKHWLTELGRLPTQAELDELIAPLLDALEAVHNAGMLHRDIKPANIYLREASQKPVLIDFGAARYALGEGAGTTAAIVSKGYSPHEAYATDGRSQGPWTDIYGLAATLYRAVSGAPPPEATGRILNDDIVPACALPAACKTYEPGFLAAIDAGLALLPNARPQSIAEWRLQMFPNLAVNTSPEGTSTSKPGFSVPGTRSAPNAVSAPSGAASAGKASSRGSLPRSSKPSTGKTPAALARGPKSGAGSIPAQAGKHHVALAVGLLLIAGGAAGLIAVQTGLTGLRNTGFVGTDHADVARQKLAEEKRQAEADAERQRQQAADAARQKVAEEKRQAEAEAERLAAAAARQKEEDDKRAASKAEVERVAAAAARQKKEDDKRQAAAKVAAERVAAAAAARQKEEDDKRQAAAKAEAERVAAAAARQKEEDDNRQAAAKAEAERVAAAAARQKEDDKRQAAAETERVQHSTQHAAIAANPQGIPEIAPPVSTEVRLQVSPEITSRVPTEVERDSYLKQVQTALKGYNCYGGQINGDLDDARGGLKRFETSYEGSVPQINLTSATVGDYEDWLTWSKGLEKFSCPNEKAGIDKQERQKLQKQESRETKKSTRPTRKEARSAPVQNRTPRQRSSSGGGGGGGAGGMTGVGF